MKRETWLRESMSSDFERFKAAVDCIEILIDEEVPLAVKMWVMRVFRRELDEIRYILERMLH